MKLLLGNGGGLSGHNGKCKPMKQNFVLGLSAWREPNIRQIFESKEERRGDF